MIEVMKQMESVSKSVSFKDRLDNVIGEFIFKENTKTNRELLASKIASLLIDARKYYTANKMSGLYLDELIYVKVNLAFDNNIFV